MLEEGRSANDRAGYGIAYLRAGILARRRSANELYTSAV